MEKNKIILGYFRPVKILKAKCLLFELANARVNDDTVPCQPTHKGPSKTKLECEDLFMIYAWLDSVKLFFYDM